MNRLHIFNPENDFALALGRRSYTPDKGARSIRKAGQLLPLWWAEDGDFVLVDSPEAVEAANKFRDHFDLPAQAILTAPSDAVADPWGWSHHTRRMLIDRGCVPQRLPSEEFLDQLRQLSHRRSSIVVGRSLGVSDKKLPVEATTVEEAMDALDRFGGRAVAKLPWSSSGRGVIYSNASPEATFRGYVKGMIRRQGSVLIEPLYDRTLDFAMLFTASNNHVEFDGLSTFLTDNRGFYVGNLVDSQERIAERIGADTTALIKPLQEALLELTSPIGYEGPIGVDMILYNGISGQQQIAPCIEINFRRTMGMAALAIARRLKPKTPLLLHDFQLQKL